MSLTVTDALLIPVADTGPDRFHGWFAVGDDGRISGIGPGSPLYPWVRAMTEVFARADAEGRPGRARRSWRRW